jgi:cellulose synthase/poly-beta-1,6-N-acetylglucosamine synthase-like glycosyltransferase
MESVMKLRKRLFGLQIRNVDRALAKLEEQVKFQGQYNEHTLYEERAILHQSLAEEDQLWAEIVQVKDRIRLLQNGGYASEASDAELASRTKPTLRLGDVLIEKEMVTEDQLLEAMDYQRQYGGRLGDILLEFQYVTLEELTSVLQQMPQKARLGELLLQQGLLTKEQLEKALVFQKNSGGMLGDILTSLGLVETEQLYKLIATQSGIGRIGEITLQENMPKLEESLARALNAIVIGERTSSYLVAVGSMLGDEQIKLLEEILEHPIEQVLGTREELEGLWKEVYHEELMDQSVKALVNEQPKNSAHVTFTKPQIATAVIMLVITCACMFIDWLVTLIVLNCCIQVFYFVMTIFKFSIIMRGTQKRAQMRYTEEEIASIDERDLPVYTILVPMYKEAHIIPHLIKNLEGLDYPKSKLDVRLLLEEDDVESIEVIHSMKLPAYYTTIVVPHSLPKTKPKACNYGLIRARGEYVVIYDAEDRPDPDQLKKVHATFAELSEEYVCVQAKLNYFNSEQNMLTRWFTHEYSMWFELLLPGVMQLDVPIPLGGTSNHFKMDVLKRINAWDPYNVTEDADLGIRLYKEGYKTAIVDSRTWEEANSQVGNWIRQRSRWIKGYMQTWLVHMRNPFRLWKEIGAKGFFGFQVMVLATPALPLLNPIFWLMILLWYGWQADFIPMFFPGAIYYISAVEFIIGNFLFVFSNVAGMYWVIYEMHKKGDKTFSFSIIKYALLTPIYWVLMSLAALKAAWQLVTKPFYWEKTTHGLTHETSSTFREEVSS